MATASLGASKFCAVSCAGASPCAGVSPFCAVDTPFRGGGGLSYPRRSLPRRLRLLSRPLPHSLIHPSHLPLPLRIPLGPRFIPPLQRHRKPPHTLHPRQQPHPLILNLPLLPRALLRLSTLSSNSLSALCAPNTSDRRSGSWYPVISSHSATSSCSCAAIAGPGPGGGACVGFG